MPLELMLRTLAAVVVGCGGTWLAAVTLGAAFEVVTGTSAAVFRAISPRVVRRLVLTCCGLAVGGAGLYAPASAIPVTADESAPGAAARTGAARLTGLPLPDRVPGVAPRPVERREASGAPGRADRSESGPVPVTLVATGLRGASTITYVVRAGDSLWTIAQRLLPTAPTDDVDEAWRRIHRANRSTVGHDPDLIIPGTTLRLPGSLTGAARTSVRELHLTHHRKDAS
jgi:nucleoid-associated protein YgaU